MVLPKVVQVEELVLDVVHCLQSILECVSIFVASVFIVDVEELSDSSENPSASLPFIRHVRIQPILIGFALLLPGRSRPLQNSLKPIIRGVLL